MARRYQVLFDPSFIDPDVRNHGGETGLHWASFGPHPDIARLLLQGDAALNVRDHRYNGTALDWALFGWARSAGQAT